MSTISNSWTGMSALGSAQLGTVVPTDNELKTAPANLLPDTFRSWTLQKQADYIKRNGSPLTIGSAVTSRPLEVKRSDEPALALTMKTQKTLDGKADGFVFTDVTAEVGLVEPAGTADFNTKPGDLAPATFLSWTRSEQLRYAVQHKFGKPGDSEVIGSKTDRGTLEVKTVHDVEMVSAGPVYGDAAATGGASRIPYYHLNGSTDGMPSQLVREQAEKLFPTIDGQKHRLEAADRPKSIYKETNDPNDPRPLRPDDKQKGFYTDPGKLDDVQAKAFLKDFMTWHSGYQIEYVKLHGSGDPTRLIIPRGSSEPVLAAMVSKSDDAKLYILSALDKAAFSKMTLADQRAIATLPGFAEVAGIGGLKAATASDAKVTDLTGKSTIPVVPETAANNLIAYINEKTAPNRSGTTMPATDRSYFTVQIDILKDQLSGMGIVSTSEITKRLQEVKDRFDRAFAFYDVKQKTEKTEAMGNPKVNITMYKDVISLDDNKTINKGYQVFIAQEKRLAETLAERHAISKDNGTLYGRRLDVPELVFRFQSLYNLQLEAVVVMETEEVNQQNALLQTYAKMQEIINKTIALFAKTDENGRGLLGKDTDDLQSESNVTKEQRIIVSMFEDLDGAGQKHPLEVLRNLSRPTFDIYRQGKGEVYNYDLNKYTHPQWSGFGTQMSEAVTIINQNSQIKMNDINSTDKQRNRHFELANSALSKLSEMINNIARAS